MYVHTTVLTTRQAHAQRTLAHHAISSMSASFSSRLLQRNDKHSQTARGKHTKPPTRHPRARLAPTAMHCTRTTTAHARLTIPCCNCALLMLTARGHRRDCVADEAEKRALAEGVVIDVVDNAIERCAVHGLLSQLARCSRHRARCSRVACKRRCDVRSMRTSLYHSFT